MNIRNNNKNIIIGTLATVGIVILFLLWFAPLFINFLNGHPEK